MRAAFGFCPTGECCTIWQTRFELECAIIRFVTILLILTGFALNLRCDPSHEWMGESNHHVEHEQDSSSSDTSKAPLSCRPHCQLMHAMAWLRAEPPQDEPHLGQKKPGEYFYEDLLTSSHASQLLRPPTARLLT